MLFHLLREIIKILILTCVILTVYKQKKKRILLAVVGCAVIYSVLSVVLPLIPFENAFIYFQTPESAFHYMNNEKDAVIEEVVEGENACMVIYRTDTCSYCFFRKTEKGYQLYTRLAYERESAPLLPRGTRIIQIKECDEHFLFGMLVNYPRAHIVEGSNGDEIHVIYTDGIGAPITYLYGAVDYSEDYQIILDGQPVTEQVKPAD